MLVCGQKYFGKKKPLPTLLSNDADSEESLRHGLTLREVADAKGAHVYDLWEYMGDSGCLFRAGTTKVVAEIVQGSAQCDDAALSDAVEIVMRQKAPKPAVKVVAKKTAAKKKPAAKAAKKVAATKKAVKKSPARR